MSETSNLEEVPKSEADAAVDEAFSRYSHGKKKKRERRSMPGEQIHDLNLTPMMDMMTVLLVFLVKNFMTDPQSIQISDSLRPPESTATVDKALAPDGILLKQYNRASAGQSIFHVHFHIVPRHEGVALAPHGKAMVDAAVLEPIAAKIRTAL